jgi:ribosome maturation factor RimP
MNEPKVIELLDALFLEEAERFAGIFIVNVEIKQKEGNPHIIVLLDGDHGGVNIDQCGRANRRLNYVFETENLFGENFSIEVSSPGVSKPLVMLRQYPKHAGRQLSILLKDGMSLIGELMETDAESITVENEVVTLDAKKKKKREQVAINIPFESIQEAKVLLPF